jgi:SpoVK/Ycf46/Vps4 family AAA+-type ATPase
MPWDLDQAVLSRFQKRIYVPLPDQKAIKEIIRIHTKELDISKLNLDELAEICIERLYSGRDTANLCQQAIWHMIEDENKNLYRLAELSFEELRHKSLKTRELLMDDFYHALAKIRPPLSSKDIERYKKWNEEFGEQSNGL